MYLYVIENTRTGAVKIGYSETPENRCRTLQTGNSDVLQVTYKAKVNTDRARLLEQKLHKEINHHRIKGEWFSITSKKARDLVDYIVIRWHDDELL